MAQPKLTVTFKPVKGKGPNWRSATIASDSGGSISVGIGASEASATKAALKALDKAALQLGGL